MSRTRLLRRDVVLLLLALGSLTSCSPGWWIAGGAGAAIVLPSTRFNPLYRGSYRAQGVEVLPARGTDTRLAFVEVDDNGWLRRPDQARALLDTLQAMSARGNVSIVVYVHGWRHNASKSDKDALAFKATLEYLSEKLDEPDFRHLRKEATGDPRTTVMGIYVGWRGKAAPEWPGLVNWANVPVYATFWNRKFSAGIVGRGDVRELLQHLGDLHERVNARTDRRMSLTMIGHSFGGHVVYDAIHARVESNLYRALAASHLDSTGWGGRFYPPKGVTESIPVRERVEGFGDLVVLINPAIEAGSYRRIDDLVRAATFPPSQVPVIITFSAENDHSRGKLFRYARGMSNFLKTSSREQSRLLGRALGSHDDQLTHRLVLNDMEPATRKLASERILDRGDGPPEQPVNAPQKQEQLVEQAVTGLVEASPRLLRFEPIEDRFRIKPAMVVRVSRHVINGHSDFFRVGFIGWLSETVLDIQRRNLEEQGKRNKEIRNKG